MADKPMTIYNYFSAIRTEVKNALDNLILGQTPIKEVRTRTIRGGGKARYVSTYYMTRMASLLTGFRWSSECLEEKFIPNEAAPREIGAKMRVTIYDGEGNKYYQEAWGQSDIKKYANNDPKGNYKIGDPMSVIDDMKAAYSDGIKKCLSYFGIANDVYGGKDLSYFGSETPRPGTEIVEGEVIDVTTDHLDPLGMGKSIFMEYLQDKHMTIGRACEILGVKDISEITDWIGSGKKIRDFLEQK